MNEVLSEKEYQHYIRDYLVQHNGFEDRTYQPSEKGALDGPNFDMTRAMDPGLLIRFLDTTQPKVMESLRKLYKEKAENTLLNYINNEVCKPGGSLIDVLKNGFYINGQHVDLMYTRPATSFNPELVEKCESNIFSVQEEVWASSKERIDLVLFLNGLALFSVELKCNAAGQDYHDAIRQYRTERDPKDRLFLWKSGCIANFAMDLEEVYVATKLSGESTFFMPFNKGRGEGINAGAGNPLIEGDYAVSYMWKDIWTKDTILDLLSKFIYVEKKKAKDHDTGKTKTKETLIFPRYHQLDLIRKVLADVKENHSSQNYLVEHSAGSGKTNSIAWLTFRLTSLHDDNDRIIFDTVIVVTDRVVVDRQLQAALLNMDHKIGQIRVMDEKCTSKDLAHELQHHTKIIATTIQKFPFIVDTVKGLGNLHFAVIIDEAHSSTSGKDMMTLMHSLGSGDEDADDAEDFVTKQLEKTGKPANLSVFAFTATPKATTLRMFGRPDEHGHYAPFHLYSMKQAIEEGFILDVLRNYITYKTMYKVDKAVADDPRLKSSAAKKQIARFAELHETNVEQHIEIIIEHFRQKVMELLGGRAKAMVITNSRPAAVRYRQKLEEYVTRKGYTDIHALVAFSGKVKFPDDDTEYSEPAMNNMKESQIPDAFDSDNYNVLLVADKYQTGFDQPKLCAMYVMKKLNGVNAVQTLSRLNRICPPYDKQVFVLDFVNSYDDMRKAFAPFYTTTFLASDMTPHHIYTLKEEIAAANLIDPEDIDGAFDIIFKKRSRSITTKDQAKLINCFGRVKKRFEQLDKKEQKRFLIRLRHFKRFYEFLMQVVTLDDHDLYKMYVFVDYLVHYLRIGDTGDGFDLKGKVRLSNFMQKKTGEYTGGKQTSEPTIRPPRGDGFELPEAKKKKLSQIISEINLRMGKDYDEDVAVKSVFQIKDIMMKSDIVRKQAIHNEEPDFELAFFENLDGALVKGMEQNRDFFTMLLNNKEVKNQLLGIFVDEIYKSIRKESHEEK